MKELKDELAPSNSNILHEYEWIDTTRIESERSTAQVNAVREAESLKAGLILFGVCEEICRHIVTWRELYREELRNIFPQGAEAFQTAPELIEVKLKDFLHQLGPAPSPEQHPHFSDTLHYMERYTLQNLGLNNPKDVEAIITFLNGKYAEIFRGIVISFYQGRIIGAEASLAGLMPTIEDEVLGVSNAYTQKTME